MAISSPIGKRLRQARTRMGLSQKELGIRAGFDEFSASPRMNQYERGKHAPDFETAAKLAAVLGVPTPFFYAEDDGMAELILRLGQLSPNHRNLLIDQSKGQLDP
ncbi:MAG: helix-turn-helix transcriptional regulator [Magnetococcales bacterium]|nr:helix-turn-helix transcriptional regulator [Magnetococcales bacterium]